MSASSLHRLRRGVGSAGCSRPGGMVVRDGGYVGGTAGVEVMVVVFGIVVVVSQA